MGMQCPECGCRVFETLTKDGWSVQCNTCDYTTGKQGLNRYQARAIYRDDFDQAFKKGISNIPVEPWQERLDNGEL